MLRTAILAGLIATLLTLGIYAVLPVEKPTQPAHASQSVVFDHTSCQYPERWSNPADGCDNSDPAVPECIKAASTQAGEQQCITEFIKQQQNVSTPTASTTLELKQEPTECK